MENQRDTTLEDVIKREARFAAIEHVLCKMMATLFLASGKKLTDVDSLMKGTSETIQKMTFARLTPVVSDAVSAEVEDSVMSLYSLVKEQMKSIAKEAGLNPHH